MPYAALPEYTLLAQAGSHGSITPTTAVVKLGASAAFSLAAEPGWVVSAVRTNGVTAWAGRTNALAFVWAEVRDTGTVEAVFAPIPDPGLRFFTLSVEAAQVTLGLMNLTPGAPYAIQRSTSPETGDWLPAGGLLPATSSTNWTQEVTTSWDRVFYRVLSLP